ncbi:PQQ-dependent sugar dehydrogenase [Cohnella rhizosphaerae]|uniref:PQQ-dependent sugar dehydrogenase n=1 Tax=Cohnella rhizosphaerae TaxID=1457232 RepID=A0A9X4KYG4_9BACL|nr:PQQ-dependent sugar dehydrogenase [Cohnella rhizosphaerae]MDG0812701.1 PQQ-dependent sugar dehydrogenase [Cohnella rhizosphaerae]
MKSKWGLYALLGLALASSQACANEPQGETAIGTTEDFENSASDNAPNNDSQPARVKLTRVFDGTRLVRPTSIEAKGDRMYVTEQEGRIVSFRTGEADAGGAPHTELDITDRVYAKGAEQGLLGLAFDPGYDDNGFIYVNYTTKTATVIARYRLPKEGEASSGDALDEQALLTFEQPYANHNGGQLAFGPDGYLYIGTGDGGGSGDPQGNAQNKRTLLGKILRIDASRTEGGKAYAIPADNPFASNGGAKEIYAYGLRNPWRFSFDADTGELWAADVGQNQFEEIDKIVKGGNYGWKLMEAKSCFEPAGGCEAAAEQTQAIDPVWSYGREAGQSVTGGYVYRGSALKALAGWYVYGDYGSGAIWALREAATGRYRNELLLESRLNITTFGLDGQGELYLTSAEGDLYRLDAQ